jgi:hypothetical protein
MFSSMAEIETLANRIEGRTESRTESRTDEKATLVCPQCSKLYQLVNPQETLVYQCQKCQAQFMVHREGTRYLALKWSEDQILKILFEIPGQSGASQISRAWRQVFDNLDDLKAHEHFIKICRQKNSLNIAKDKYKQLSLYLNWSQLPQSLREIIEPQQVSPSVWSERMPWILLAAAAIIMLLGAILPGQRNMVGAGVLVLILDFLIYRKRFQALL